MSELKAIFVGFYGPHNNPSPYKLISCLLLTEHGDVVARGLSICSPLDRFDKRKGQQIAMGRAMRAHENTQRNRWRITDATLRRRIAETGAQRDMGEGIIPRFQSLRWKAERFPALTVREAEAVMAWRKRNLLIDNNGLFTSPKEPCKEPIKKSKSCECEPCTCAKQVSLNSTIAMVNHELPA